jgi:hypothetical protein
LKEGPSQGPLKNLKGNMYIPYFLVHNSLVFFFVTLALIKEKDMYSYYIAIGLTMVHIVYLTVKRPYEAGFSNFSIIFNQCVILFSFFWVLSKGTPIDTISSSLIFIYISIGTFYSVNAFGIIRSLVAIKEAYWNKKKGPKPEKVK